ncbi:hypothetical protein ES332_A12G275700v1 [Gossypium tomentosum]|uniref:Uncharacterized protein n=1 Tax=Gossypium tomentosum TaxID=34277 RepID=A0A5D2N212_GOSTO|nr:hypothetical protein ES332_A12G275700v1 [Gossypium tomentosum]
MAFSRSLSSRATLIARRYRPSFAYIFHDDDRKTHPSNEPQSPQKPVPQLASSSHAHASTTTSRTPQLALYLHTCKQTRERQQQILHGVTPFTPYIPGPIFVSFFMATIFCYWITSNLFSLGYGLVLKVPGVKKALGVPEIPKQPVVTRPSIDLYTALKQTLKQAKTASQQSTSLPIDPTEVAS